MSFRLLRVAASTFLLGGLCLVPAPANAAVTVTIKAPTSVVSGDPVTVRGAVTGPRRYTVELQSRTSSARGWEAIDRHRRIRGDYRFTTTPSAATRYRVVAERRGVQTTSRTISVVLTDPVFRWFHLYDLGTNGGDPDGFWMDFWTSTWGEDGEFDDRGYEADVDVVDRADWATFQLAGACTRLTGAIGNQGAGQAAVVLSDDSTSPLLERTFGPGQWQRLDLDVTGRSQLKLSADWTEGDEAAIVMHGARVFCDSRFAQPPALDDGHQWRTLEHLGSSDGDPDGFWFDDWSSLPWEDRYDDTAFVSEVSDSDVEDWVEFQIPSGCSRLDAALGGAGSGQAELRILDQDGRLLHQRAYGGQQWQRLDLSLAGVEVLRVTATSLTSDEAETNFTGGRLLCRKP